MSSSTWITLTAVNLYDYLVAEQVDALRQQALGSGQADPFGLVAPDVIRKVRGFIASQPANQLDSTDLTIPPELKMDVCYLIIAPLMGRLNQTLTEDQKTAIKSANDTLKAISLGNFKVSKPDTAAAVSVQGGAAVALVSSRDRQTTRCTLQGI